MYTSIAVSCGLPCFSADLDPIYYCELLRTCAINDHGDAHITSLKVVPVQVEKGETPLLVPILRSDYKYVSSEVSILREYLQD